MRLHMENSWNTKEAVTTTLLLEQFCRLSLETKYIVFVLNDIQNTPHLQKEMIFLLAINFFSWNDMLPLNQLLLSRNPVAVKYFIPVFTILR